MRRFLRKLRKKTSTTSSKKAVSARASKPVPLKPKSVPLEPLYTLFHKLNTREISEHQGLIATFKETYHDINDSYITQITMLANFKKQFDLVTPDAVTPVTTDAVTPDAVSTAKPPSAYIFSLPKTDCDFCQTQYAEIKKSDSINIAFNFLFLDLLIILYKENFLSNPRKSIEFKALFGLLHCKPLLAEYISKYQKIATNLSPIEQKLAALFATLAATDSLAHEAIINEFKQHHLDEIDRRLIPMIGDLEKLRSYFSTADSWRLDFTRFAEFYVSHQMILRQHPKLLNFIDLLFNSYGNNYYLDKTTMQYISFKAIHLTLNLSVQWENIKGIQEQDEQLDSAQQLAEDLSQLTALFNGKTEEKFEQDSEKTSTTGQKPAPLWLISKPHTTLHMAAYANLFRNQVELGGGFDFPRPEQHFACFQRQTTAVSQHPRSSNNDFLKALKAHSTVQALLRKTTVTQAEGTRTNTDAAKHTQVRNQPTVYQCLPSDTRNALKFTLFKLSKSALKKGTLTMKPGWKNSLFEVFLKSASINLQDATINTFIQTIFKAATNQRHLMNDPQQWLVANHREIAGQILHIQQLANAIYDLKAYQQIQQGFGRQASVTIETIMQAKRKSHQQLLPIKRLLIQLKRDTDTTNRQWVIDQLTLEIPTLTGIDEYFVDQSEPAASTRATPRTGAGSGPTFNSSAGLYQPAPTNKRAAARRSPDSTVQVQVQVHSQLKAPEV